MRAKTQKLNFTKGWIERLATPEAGRTIFYDKQVPGLGITVYDTGRKTFHWFRSVKCKPIWRSLGDYGDQPGELNLEAARDAAGEKNKLRSAFKASGYKGPSPFDRTEPAVAPEVLTLEGLMNAYIQQHLREHAKRPEKAEKDLRWVIDRYLSDWKERPAAEIRPDEVAARHREIGAKLQRTANVVAKTLRTLYRFGHRADFAELKGMDIPTKSVSFYHEAKRSRFLQPDELPKLWAALRVAPNPDLRDFVNLALWTGARKSDILSMRWQDVSLSDNRWAIPDPKNRTPYVVPLTPEAVSILKARVRIVDNPWVFPSHGKSGRIVSLKNAWKNLLIAAGLYRPNDKDLRLTFHDLRRTQGSWLAAQGTSLPIIGKALGHQSAAATQIYSRLMLDPVREAMTLSNAAISKAMRRKMKPVKALAVGG